MLTGNKIKECVLEGTITIEPFDPAQCGPNSYDVRIGEDMHEVLPNVGSYDEGGHIDLGIASRTFYMRPMTTSEGIRGFALRPGVAYLAHTVEVIGSNLYVPVYHGRSSTARHGLMTHYAGLGDLGWKGQLVLELVNMTGFPMFLPIGVRVGQVSFHNPEGVIELYNSTYQGQRGIVPAKGLT